MQQLADPTSSKPSLPSIRPSLRDTVDYQPDAQTLSDLLLMPNEFGSPVAVADKEVAEGLLLGPHWYRSRSESPTTTTSMGSDESTTARSFPSHKTTPQSETFATSCQHHAYEEHSDGCPGAETGQSVIQAHEPPLCGENEHLQTRSVLVKHLEDDSITHEHDQFLPSSTNGFARRRQCSIAPAHSTLDSSQQRLQSLVADVLLREGADASQIDVPIDLFALGNDSGAPLTFSPVQLQTSTILEDMVTMMWFEVDAASVSADDVTKLIRTARFLFGAQAYEHCHAVSEFTWRLVQVNDLSGKSFDTSFAWLEVAINLIRSSTCLKDLRRCADIIDLTPPNGHSYPNVVRKELAILYACLGEALHGLSDDYEADKAAFECWTTSQFMASIQECSLTQSVVSAATKHIIQQNNHKPLPAATYKQLHNILGTSGQLLPECQESNKSIHMVLVWCVNALGQPGFTTMISNIDEKFWKTPDTAATDVEKFERLVTYSYLCGCLWRHERLDKCKLMDRTDADVAVAFEGLHSSTGLTSEDVIGAVTQLLFHPVPVNVDRFAQATMATRYHARLDNICRQLALKAAGFQRAGRTLTSELLLEHHHWPGKSCYIDGAPDEPQFRNSEYATSVGAFLREFASIGLELAESKVLQPVLTCFHAGRAISDETLVSRTARSSQMSDDLKAFRATGKRRSDHSMQSLPQPMQILSTGFDDVLSESFSGHRIFRYSGSG